MLMNLVQISQHTGVQPYTSKQQWKKLFYFVFGYKDKKQA